jgi:hypothetical protein
MTRLARTLLLVAVGGTLAVSLPAAAQAVGNPVINDCEHNPQLTQQWSLSQLEHALKVMPADIKEYSDCYDVIHEAILKDRRAGGGGTGSGSGGSFLPTPVIVILVILVLLALGFAAMALRGRRSAAGGRPPDPGP